MTDLFYACEGVRSAFTIYVRTSNERSHGVFMYCTGLRSSIPSSRGVHKKLDMQTLYQKKDLRSFTVMAEIFDVHVRQFVSNAKLQFVQQIYVR